jgi:Aspartyl protease
MIPIRVIGPAGDDDLRALVDTGSDDTLLPDSLIGLLGVALRPGDQAVIVGIEGSTTVVRYGTVDLEIPGAGGGYRWSARVGFHASFRVVLGHIGFLEYFTASFNGRTRQLTLTPNGTAPAPTIPTS